MITCLGDQDDHGGHYLDNDHVNRGGHGLAGHDYDYHGGHGPDDNHDNRGGHSLTDHDHDNRCGPDIDVVDCGGGKDTSS